MNRVFSLSVALAFVSALTIGCAGETEEEDNAPPPPSPAVAVTVQTEENVAPQTREHILLARQVNVP